MSRWQNRAPTLTEPNAAKAFALTMPSQDHGIAVLEKGALLAIGKLQRLLAAFSDFNECTDRKSTRLNSSHVSESRMPSSA